MRHRHLARVAVIAAVAVALAVSGSPPSSASTRQAPPASTYYPKDCTARHSTLAAIGRCASHELAAARSQLNAALAAERRVVPATKVRSDEAKWLHLVNKECAYEADAYRGLTRTVDDSSCRLSLTDVRIGEVRQIVDQITAASTPTTEQAPPAAMEPAAPTDFPVVVCPTDNADGQPALSAPTYLEVSVPDSLSGRLAVYADNRNRMAVVGPTGWHCSAVFGEDGSGGVQVYPGPQQSASFAIAQDAEAIVGGESGACAGCTLGQACPLFANAARADTASGFPACTKPNDESVNQIGPTVVGFLDPPGVHGSGDPSGGPYPANGVVTYNPSPAASGSWEETCTLPAADHGLCTVALNTFVRWYGTR